MSKEILTRLADDIGYVRGKVDSIDARLTGLEPRIRRLESFRSRCLGVVAFVTAAPGIVIAILKGRGHS